MVKSGAANETIEAVDALKVDKREGIFNSLS